MGKAWPIGPNDEPVGWFRRTALPGDVEYQDAEYREDEPKPVAPAMHWKAWKRARLVTNLCLLASFLFYVTHGTWGAWWLFMAGSFAWAIVFWSIRELKHQEMLLRMEEMATRAKVNPRQRF